MGFIPLSVEFSQFDLEAAMRRNLLQKLDWFHGSSPEPLRRSTKEQRVNEQIRMKLEETRALAEGSDRHTATSTRLRIERRWHNYVRLSGYGYLYRELEEKVLRCCGRFALLSSHEKGRARAERGEKEYYFIFLSDYYPQDPVNPWRPAHVQKSSGKMLVWEEQHGHWPGGGDLGEGVKLMLPGICSVKFESC